MFHSRSYPETTITYIHRLYRFRSVPNKSACDMRRHQLNSLDPVVPECYEELLPHIPHCQSMAKCPQRVGARCRQDDHIDHRFSVGLHVSQRATPESTAAVDYNMIVVQPTEKVQDRLHPVRPLLLASLIGACPKRSRLECSLMGCSHSPQTPIHTPRCGAT